MENQNTETTYNLKQFHYFNFKCQNATKTCVLESRIRIQKRAYNCRQLMYYNFKWKNAKSMRFEIDNPVRETTYNCMQFLYLNFIVEKL